MVNVVSKKSIFLMLSFLLVGLTVNFLHGMKSKLERRLEERKIDKDLILKSWDDLTEHLDKKPYVSPYVPLSGEELAWKEELDRKIKYLQDFQGCYREKVFFMVELRQMSFSDSVRYVFEKISTAIKGHEREEMEDRKLEIAATLKDKKRNWSKKLEMELFRVVVLFYRLHGREADMSQLKKELNEYLRNMNVEEIQSRQLDQLERRYRERVQVMKKRKTEIMRQREAEAVSPVLVEHEKKRVESAPEIKNLKEKLESLVNVLGGENGLAARLKVISE